MMKGAMGERAFEGLMGRLFAEPVRCRWCEREMRGPVLGYPHDGGETVPGIASPEANGKWWLYLRCGGCGYMWSLRKLAARHGSEKAEV